MSVEMKVHQRFEFRIESVHGASPGTTRADALVARLNELGREGWRVAAIDLTGHPSYAEREIPVLLERPIEQ